MPVLFSSRGSRVFMKLYPAIMVGSNQTKYSTMWPTVATRDSRQPVQWMNFARLHLIF